MSEFKHAYRRSTRRSNGRFSKRPSNRTLATAAGVIGAGVLAGLGFKNKTIRRWASSGKARISASKVGDAYRSARTRISASKVGDIYRSARTRIGDSKIAAGYNKAAVSTKKKLRSLGYKVNKIKRDASGRKRAIMARQSRPSPFNKRRGGYRGFMRSLLRKTRRR